MDEKETGYRKYAKNLVHNRAMITYEKLQNKPKQFQALENLSKR